MAAMSRAHTLWSSLDLGYTLLAVQATSAGAKDQEAENFLEKKVKGSPLSLAQAVQTAIAALQSVLSEDFKASEIEVRWMAQPRLASLCW